jgi:GT2 family glycosyltransferase
MEAEVWVVDNASTDGSLEYLMPLFNWVKFIPAGGNLGFGKANNLAAAQAKGDYIVYLNPDTIVPEDCFTQCLAFMDSHADAGALGIKMTDGGGVFLPESKRAFPAPLTSFYKLTGLAGLFPASAVFNRYALGHLSPNKTHSVDVLAGAFMLLKRKVYKQTQGFDEAFFMYGEDVDLSYRILQAGYKNYYFAGSSIIHFKGESTKRGSLNYVKMFYAAMSVFVQKHYGKGKAATLVVLLQLAIWLRAGIAAAGKLTKMFAAPTKNTAVKKSAFCILGNAAEINMATNLLLPYSSCIDSYVLQTATDIAGLTTYIQQHCSNKEVVFCAGSLSYKTIIGVIQQLPGFTGYYWYAAGSNSIVGSNHKNVAGTALYKTS